MHIDNPHIPYNLKPITVNTERKYQVKPSASKTKEMKFIAQVIRMSLLYLLMARFKKTSLIRRGFEQLSSSSGWPVTDCANSNPLKCMPVL